MSNVLIGIIGVILFIGLALAGALILGDDFKSAGSSTKGAQYISTIQQVTSAGSMYQLKTGTRIGSERNETNLNFLIPRFLKSQPAGNPYFYTYSNGTIVYMNLGTDSKAEDVCGELQRTLGVVSPTSATNTTTIDLSVAFKTWSTGCVKHSTGQFAAYGTL